MTLETLKKEVCDIIASMSDKLLNVSHEIHANPELAMEETKAVCILVEAIKEAGLPVEEGVYGLKTAFQTEFGNSEGPCVAILAEYDALPDIGHACGHNLIATSALGAALALYKLNDKLPGKIRLMGTPGEEGAAGKVIMQKQGAFEGVDAAMAMHPFFANLVTLPTICAVKTDVIYHGRPSHASAQPEQGINALDGLVCAYQAIGSLRQHISSLERIHGIITDGGQAPNVVPERAAGTFVVRAANANDLEALRIRVNNCFKGGALASGSRVEIKCDENAYYNVRTSWPLAEHFKTNAEALGREFTPLEDLPPNTAGSSDMGNVSYCTPAIHPTLAASPSDCSIHHPDFTKYSGSEMGDKSAIDGAKAMAMTTLDFLFNSQLREDIKKQFETDVAEGGSC